MRIRQELAARFIVGGGLEIGALHSPLILSPHAKARYVDRMSVENLRLHYPELHELPLVHVDIVDNGETLVSVESDSVDFVISSHLLEHTQNPIGAIKNWVRVLKPGGILFMCVPFKEDTFDKDRPVTKLEHLIRDYKEGPEWSREGHFEEWVRLVDRTRENDVKARVKQLMQQDYSIHFHVWTECEVLELMVYCKQHVGIPVRIEFTQSCGFETVIVLRKLSTS